MREVFLRFSFSTLLICFYRYLVVRRSFYIFATYFPIPPLDILVQIAVIFNVSLDYLVGIDKNEMVSIEGLTDGQKKTILNLIAEFKKSPIPTPSLTDSQQAILNQVLVEFNRKA